MANGGGFKWDGTISLGSIIAAVIIIIPLIGGAYVTVNQVAGIQTTMDKQGEKFDTRLKAVEDRIGDIQLEMAKADGFRAKVDDHEARLRRTEQRITILEGRR